MTEDQRKERNEQKKHQRINEKYCHTILMKDWETFEELLPYGNPKPTNGNNILVVCNKQGTKFFKHTIQTEELSQEEAQIVANTTHEDGNGNDTIIIMYNKDDPENQERRDMRRSTIESGLKLTQLDDTGDVVKETYN